MERFANVLCKDGHMAPSTSSKKDLGVVTLLVIAEKERASFFFFAKLVPSLRMRRPFSCLVLCFWEFLHFLYKFLI